MGTCLVLLAAVVLAATALTSCAGPDETGSVSSRVSSWLSGTGGAAIGTLGLDARNIDLAVARHDPPSELRTVCALITNDAESAIGNLPSPDSRLTEELDSAYQDAAAAGDSCYNGAGGNRALLDRSAAERSKLAPLLEAAVARIETLTGHVPSTSTTAPPPSGDPFAG
ncbi:MAG: hypothetical protein ACYDES_00770 [Acidimicrobiales bacterium]